MPLKQLKRYPLIIVLFLQSCTQNGSSKPASNSKTNSQHIEIQTLADLNNSTKLLNYLYGSNQFDAKNRILWKPASGKSRNLDLIPVSYDSFIHTEVDTVLFFRNSNGNESAVVILANPNIQLDRNTEIITGSHFEGVSLGVALFTKHKDQWRLYGFQKHLINLGYFGEYRTGREDQGHIYLRKLGNNWTALCFQQGIGGNTGDFSGKEIWYSIEKNAPEFEYEEEPNEINQYDYTALRQIFNYTYSHNYYFPDLDNQNVIKINLSTLKTKSPLYDLKLDVEKSNYHVETNKLNTFSKKSIYFKFSKQLHLFVRK